MLGDGNESSLQDTRALCPEAGSSCTLTLTPVNQHLVTSSAALHCTHARELGAEKFHTFNVFIHCSALYISVLLVCDS